MLNKVLIVVASFASVSFLACTPNKHTVVSSENTEMTAPATGDNKVAQDPAASGAVVDSAVDAVNKSADVASKAVDATTAAAADVATSVAGKVADKTETAVDATKEAMRIAADAAGKKVTEATEATKNAITSGIVAKDDVVPVPAAAQTPSEKVAKAHVGKHNSMKHSKMSAKMRMNRDHRMASKSGKRVMIMSAAKCPVIGLKAQKSYVTASNPQYRTLLSSRMMGSTKVSRMCLPSVTAARKLGLNSSKFARK